MSTILFKEDWLKYPNAIIHTNTNNKEWLKMAYKLREMGVYNCEFLLALHNPMLEFVDPHSPNLTQKQMEMIYVECVNNFWYYVREVARAPAQTGTGSNQVSVNRYVLSYWWSCLNHITYIGTVPRQCGKSFGADIIGNWLMGFACKNTTINLLTKDDTLRANNIKRLKEMYDELPPYLNLKTREDANNTEVITVMRNNNKYLTHVPQASIKRAYNLGRGLTSPVWFGDELPFVVNVRYSLGAALASMGAVVEEAKAKNEPYFISMTTTAGKRDDDSGQYMYEFISDAAQWSERFYDAKDEADLRIMVGANARKKGAYRIYGCFTHRQLGKSDAWLLEQLQNTNQSPDDANRDYFNTWTSGTSSSPLPLHILEQLAKHAIPESHTQISPIGSYIMRWYIDEKYRAEYLKTRRTIIGIDTSDAVGGDDISFVMIDVETGGTIAAATFNMTSLITFAQFLVWVLMEMPLATMIIERKSSAITIIDYLLDILPQKGIDPFQRLFNWIMNDPMLYKSLYEEAILPMRRRPDDLYARCKKYFGFATSSGGQTSRTELYSTTLQASMRRSASKVLDRALIGQITGLIVKNGRVDHGDGKHDDLVIGYLLANWFLTHAKNLISYGIDPTHVLIETREVAEVKPEQTYITLEQQHVREEIQRLFDMMNNETDEYVLNKLEQRLRYYSGKLILSDNENFNIDSVLGELKKQKRINRLYR